MEPDHTAAVIGWLPWEADFVVLELLGLGLGLPLLFAGNSLDPFTQVNRSAKKAAK